jgi:23S rRNA pseudouridine2605 synthase
MSQTRSRKNSPTGIRLQKVLAERGLCSRREADLWIQEGSVKVNGRVAEPGTRVDPDKDQIVVKGKGLPPKVHLEPITLVVNKPKGLICSHRDPHHIQTIYDLIPRRLQNRRFICAGRLDKNSEGLVILTTQGSLANKIMHPSNEVIKRYRVQLNRPFPPGKIPLLLEGKEVEGELLKAEKVITSKRGKDADTRLEVHLNHGKKREIRKLFEAFGFYVKKLKRFQIGKLVLRGIPPGGIRPLTQHEIESLLE